MIYNSMPNDTYLCATIIDEDSLEKPLPKCSMNIFVKEKVSWYDIPDTDGPSYQTFSKGWTERYPWAKEVARKLGDSV